MITRFSVFAVGATLFTMSACSPSANHNSDAAGTDPQTDCVYSYDHESTKFAWTAFKFTERVGVGGTFDTVLVRGVQSGASSPGDVIRSLEFEIPVASVNTQNPDRDMKIQRFFFGTLAGTDTIRGRVASVNDSTGVVKLAVAMNGVNRMVEMNLTEEGSAWNLETTIDVNDWNASTGIDSLNNVCYDLHKGADGVSVLWPEVKLELSTVFKTDCD